MGKEPFLKFVSRRVDLSEQRHLLHIMRSQGFQYNGSLPSLRGEYWLFSPIGWDAETKEEKSGCK